VLLVVSLLVAFALFGAGFLPQWFLATTAAIFAGAVTIYEVLYKAVYLGAIKGGNKATK
jgi:hypothetical protein